MSASPKSVNRSITAYRGTRTTDYHQVRQLPKAQTDPENYTKHPHAYGDVLLRGGKLGGVIQHSALYWIERHTIGTNSSKRKGITERPEWARLSLSQLAQLCPAWDGDKLRPVERKSVAIALADLVARGIIAERDRPEGSGKTTAKMYKLTPERWEAAPPYKPPTVQQIEAAEPDDDDDDEEDDYNAAADSGADGPEIESTVQPGRRSRPQPVPLRMATGAPAVSIRVIYNSDLDEPVTFRTQAQANGVLSVTASPAAPRCTPARLVTQTARIDAKTAGYVTTGSAKKRPGTPAICSHAQPQITGEEKVNSKQNKPLTDFELYAQEISLKTWGKRVAPADLKKIIAAAGGAPLEYFARIADQKLSGRHRHQPGLLMLLADDARKAWEMANQIKAQRAAVAARRTTRDEARPRLPQDAAADAAAERVAAEKERDRRARCEGCEGTGKRESGITGRFKTCGVCKGTGRKPGAESGGVEW